MSNYKIKQPWSDGQIEAKAKLFLLPICTALGIGEHAARCDDPQLIMEAAVGEIADLQATIETARQEYAKLRRENYKIMRAALLDEDEQPRQPRAQIRRIA